MHKSIINNKLPSKAYQLMAEMLQEFCPIGYRACADLFTPALKDLTLISFIHSELGKIYDHGPEMHPKSLAVIFKLYAPHKLYTTNIRMDAGIRRAVCVAMNWNNTTVVNHYQQILTSYYKVPSFKKHVNDLAAAILEKINQNKLE